MTTITCPVYNMPVTSTFFPAPEVMKHRMQLIIYPVFCTVKASPMNWISGATIFPTIGPPGAKCCPIIWIRGFRARGGGPPTTGTGGGKKLRNKESPAKSRALQNALSKETP